MRGRVIALTILVSLFFIATFYYVNQPHYIVYSKTDEGEYAGIANYSGSTNLPRDIEWSEFSWQDPGTGADYTNASWSYQVDLVVKGISEYNATIKIRGKETSSATWSQAFDSKTWTNQIITDPDTQQTLTFLDSGSELIDNHMNRFVSNPQSGITYTIQYQIYFEFHGIGAKSGTILNVTLNWADISSQPSSKWQDPNPTITSATWGGSDVTSSITDGNDNTYVGLLINDDEYITIIFSAPQGLTDNLRMRMRIKAADGYTSNPASVELQRPSNQWATILLGSKNLNYLDGPSWYFGDAVLTGSDWDYVTDPDGSNYKTIIHFYTTTVAHWDVIEIEFYYVTASWLPIGFPAIVLILVLLAIAIYTYRGKEN